MTFIICYELLLLIIKSVLALVTRLLYKYFKITMSTRLVPLFLLLIAGVLGQITINQTEYITPCIAFQGGNCIACPYNYHIYQNQCYLNVTACQEYAFNASGYEICNVCDGSVSVADGNGGCTLTVSLQRMFILT